MTIYVIYVEVIQLEEKKGWNDDAAWGTRSLNQAEMLI